MEEVEEELSPEEKALKIFQKMGYPLCRTLSWIGGIIKWKYYQKDINQN